MFVASSLCQVVCVCNGSLTDALALDAAAAAARAESETGFVDGPFVVAVEARGAFGRVFCDFGDAFVVSDTDGETVKTAMLASIEQVCGCE